MQKALVISALILTVGAVYTNLFLNRRAATLQRLSLAQFPTGFDGWVGRDSTFSNELLAKLGVDEYIMREFSREGDRVNLYIGYYSRQGEGVGAHSPRHCYPSSGWNPVQGGIINLPAPNREGESFQANQYVFANGNARECVVYWYQSRGRLIANEYHDRILLVWDALTRNRTDGALIRLSLRTEAGQEEESLAKVREFASTLHPILPRYIPQ